MSRDDLENLFRNHLSGELDSQRGRAAREFDTRVLAPMRHGLAVRQRQWRSARRWGLLGSAMAACVAFAFALPQFFASSHHEEVASVLPGDRAATPPLNVISVGLGYTSAERALDAGPVLLDGDRPGRKIIQHRVDQNRWRDSSTGGRFEVTESSENSIVLQVHRQ